jgi:hypothetical protein
VASQSTRAITVALPKYNFGQNRKLRTGSLGIRSLILDGFPDCRPCNESRVPPAVSSDNALSLPYKLPAQAIIVCQAVDQAGQCRSIVAIELQRPVSRNLRKTTCRSDRRRDAARHGLERWEAESFRSRRQYEAGRALIEPGETPLWDRTKEVDPPSQDSPRGQLPQALVVTTRRTHDDQVQVRRHAHAPSLD